MVVNTNGQFSSCLLIDVALGFAEYQIVAWNVSESWPEAIKCHIVDR